MSIDYAWCFDNPHEAAKAIDDLQQKVIQLEADLLQSQASEARLRQALKSTLWTLKGKGLPPNPTDAGSMMTMVKHLCEANIEQALSTPPNTAELESYVESKIEKRLGEQVINGLKQASEICNQLSDSDVNDGEFSGIRMCEVAIDAAIKNI
jgi:hypothetical protein